ncbi:probable G-protein coupled receptor B0563.6 [Hyalella azteca]|uniref:Probable G-protein coupled receptor B0563.6 n=1 Tax=Hyalella azteca TaxID=294128 RepID=A0A8B7NV85_HYAAZ|nr:probable G-protein coupled receptor B0563.6 [Hyalella azteca]
MYIEYWIPPPTTPPPTLSPALVTSRTRKFIPSYTPTTQAPDVGVSAEEQQIWKTRQIAYGYIAPTFIFVGILGNLLTILILRHTRFKGMTYTFFRILAWSDLVSLLFCISFVVHMLQPLTPSYATAFWYAHFEGFCVNVPMTISVLTVVLITIERYFSVCRPTHFKQIHSNKYAKIGFGVSVGIAAVIWLPVCFMKSVREYTDCDSYNFGRPPKSNQTYYVACMERNTLDSVAYMFYSWTRQVIVSFIPIALLIVLNVLIIRRYIQVAKKRHSLRQASPADDEAKKDGAWSTKEDRNLIRMLCAVMISFSITMFPPGIANAIYTEFLSTKLQYEIFRAVANDLEILNHTMNFYLYMLLSKPVRAAVKGYFNKALNSINESLNSVEHRTKPELQHQVDAPNSMTQTCTEVGAKNPSASSGYQISPRPISQVCLVQSDSSTSPISSCTDELSENLTDDRTKCPAQKETFAFANKILLNIEESVTPEQTP